MTWQLKILESTYGVNIPILVHTLVVGEVWFVSREGRVPLNIPFISITQPAKPHPLRHFPMSQTFSRFLSVSLSLSLILYFIVTTFDVMPVWLLIISWIYRWKSSFLHSLVPMFWDPTTLKTITLTECRYMSFFFRLLFIVLNFLGTNWVWLCVTLFSHIYQL